MHGLLIALLIAAAGQTSPSPIDRDPIVLVDNGPLAAYVYPGATATDAGAVAELHRLVMTTPAPPAEVLGFYESLLGETLSATCLHGRADGWVTSCNDSRLPPSEGVTTEPLVLHVLSQKSGRTTATIVISRAAGEELTHIVLLLVTEA